MKSLSECTLSDLKDWLHSQNEKEFRANQVFEWIYQKGVHDWSKMTNLSLSLREKLAQNFAFPLLKLIHVMESNDRETFKFLWQLSDGNLIESVLICSEERRTVCVSSQVGCPAKCAFCASGKQGFLRDLTVAEILEQVLLIQHWLAQKNERVSHVVYMGMGEPFRNYDAVVKSIRFLTHPEMLNISQRRITLSTVGVVEGIRKFAEEGLKINLVLSLHAPNQKIRQKIIPYARQYSLEEIMFAMDDYARKTKRDITYEYTLIEGINDQPDHASELAQMLQGRQCTVNLIPYNPIIGIRLKRPDVHSIQQFRTVLNRNKIINTCRYTKGDDIAAACGQLAMQQKEGLPLVSP
jgi:23S rRNA (adenine2503-C2)-methyltransferase